MVHHALPAITALIINVSRFVESILLTPHVSALRQCIAVLTNSVDKVCVNLCAPKKGTVIATVRVMMIVCLNYNVPINHVIRNAQSTQMLQYRVVVVATDFYVLDVRCVSHLLEEISVLTRLRHLANTIFRAICLRKMALNSTVSVVLNRPATSMLV